ncbi:6424_t:CDS:2, partial [Acaulospora colombiana]
GILGRLLVDVDEENEDEEPSRARSAGGVPSSRIEEKKEGYQDLLEDLIREGVVGMVETVVKDALQRGAEGYPVVERPIAEELDRRHIPRPRFSGDPHPTLAHRPSPPPWSLFSGPRPTSRHTSRQTSTGPFLHAPSDMFLCKMEIAQDTEGLRLEKGLQPLSTP